MRAKLEYEKSGKGKRHNAVSKSDVPGDVNTENSDETLAAPATSTDYIPPWFDRYIQYKFYLLDRAGQINRVALLRKCVPLYF